MTATVSVPKIPTTSKAAKANTATNGGEAAIDPAVLAEIKDMNLRDLWALRGRALNNHPDFPADIRRALVTRPVGSNIRQMVADGCFDEPLARALIWERDNQQVPTARTTVTQCSATPAPSTMRGAAATTVKLTAEQQLVDRLIAELAENDPNSHLPAALRAALAKGATLPKAPVVTATAEQVAAATAITPFRAPARRPKIRANGTKPAASSPAKTPAASLTHPDEPRVQKIMRLVRLIDPRFSDEEVFVRHVLGLTADELKVQSHDWQRATIAYLEWVIAETQES
jgi:hypothetical protein